MNWLQLMDFKNFMYIVYTKKDIYNLVEEHILTYLNTNHVTFIGLNIFNKIFIKCNIN